MAACDKKGFTLIEMMVALVVGGLLMASLVALSSSVQKSFGRSKDITELQANLRFTMKLLVDDFSRLAYMSSPDPGDEEREMCHRHPLGNLAVDGDYKSIAYDSDDNSWTLRGNFVSSRDYLISKMPHKVLCRNGLDPVKYTNCEISGASTISNTQSVQKQFMPFADGPPFCRIFKAGLRIQLDTGDGRYSYHIVSGIGEEYGHTLTPVLNPDIPGDDFWVSPISAIEYRFEEDGDYTERYSTPTADAARWVLWRETQGDRVEVGEFLLPPPDGFNIEVYNAANIAISTPVVSGADVDPPAAMRAIMITLRARTEVEDPRLSINDLDPASRNFGVDLDGDAENGLARVRMEQTVVELRNLALNPCLAEH
ncbi:MAG: prepilin-type N-terminal cleavage/methylation domain-containing protein [Deltaproteobacteria bacterium]|nr:prepilin-type N-terminal cleavage/methylation domain-containing protein [Deltaproteobacteria bacterium]